MIVYNTMVIMQLVYLTSLVLIVGAAFYWVFFSTPPKSPSHPQSSQKENSISSLNNFKSQPSESTNHQSEPEDNKNNVSFKQWSFEQENAGNSMRNESKVSSGQNQNDSKNSEQKGQQGEQLILTFPPSMGQPNHLSNIKQFNSEIENNSEILPQEQVSQCNQIKIRANSRKQRQKRRLQTVKSHYKKIIEELQGKLSQVCLRNQESLNLERLNETITFSEEESMTTFQDEEIRYQVNFEEINNLKEQLQFHEEVVTNLLEEDKELKDKLRFLQEENQKLKQSRKQDNQDDIKVSEQQQRKESVDFIFPKEEAFNKVDTKNRQTSPIKNLYTSQIVTGVRQSSSLLASRRTDNPSAMSTISLMSIVQGAICIGLLGECRFLNEISKKFTVNEIKKILKKRILDAELIYSTKEEDENKKSFPQVLQNMNNILVLSKFSNGKGIGIFIERVSRPDSLKEGCIAILDLTKRKSTHGISTCVQTKEGLVIGKQEIELSSSQPHAFLIQQFGTLIPNKSKVSEFLDSSRNKSIAEHLEIFILYPSQ